MSHDTPPPMPNHPPPTPKKNRTNLIIIGAAAAVIAAVVGTGIVVVQSNTDDPTPPTASAAPTTPSEDATAGVEEEPEPVYDVPTADDFTMELRTTRRKCFGSAGCNVTVEPELTYDGLTEDLDPDAVYEITYEIGGVEDGPVIETAELSEQSKVSYSQVTVSTASAGAELSVEVTGVVTREY